MTELSHSTRLSVVEQGEQDGRWQQLLESELARTHNLAAELAQADALVVVIGPSFSEALDCLSGKKNRCVEAIRGALAQGKMLLPVTVGGAALPGDGLLPEDIRALNRFQAVTLDRESSVPGVAARLVVSARAAAQRYVPADQGGRRVFISYRRDDCWYWASLLGTALTLRLGAPNVFFDIGSIALGRRFDTEIQSRLRASTDVVVLVGPTFLACDEMGRRRLDDPDDFVRLEIAAAVRNRKAIHIILIGDATMPESAQLPADIAPAFRGAAPQRLKDHRGVGALADAIVMGQPALTLFGPDLPFLTGKHKEERFITDAGWRLAELGWRPVNLADSKGTVAMTRPDADGFRFVFDFQRFDLVLEERTRSLSSLGLKRWVRRARFPFGLDDTDRDAVTPSDEQVEAMANPGAYLDRVGRLDLDSRPTPPKSLPWLYEFVRDNSQPGRRALDQQARELARIRAKGGLPKLSRIARVALGEDVTAQALAFNAVTGQFVVASNYGLYAIDAGQASARRLGPCLDLTLVASSCRGLVAGATYKNRLWVLDGDGAEIVKGKTPYSLWQRRAGEHQRFATLSWHADETRIAIGGSDHIWIYRLDSDAFERLPLRDDENLMSEGASALFVPGSDDLVVMQRWTVWRVSEVTGRTGALLNTEAGSDFYDPHSNDLFSRKRGPTGFIPHCIALSADGSRLAAGGNDAQLVLLDSVNLQPLTMRVWHLPLVDAERNGEVEALAFSPDGRMLASVANDNRLVIGDAGQGDPLAEAKLSIEAIRPYLRCKCRVCWSADGAQVAVTNGEGRIEIFGY